MTGFGIIIPVFPQRLESLGLGAETLALMEGGFGLGMFLFSTPMGTLAGRFGRKPIILLALGGFILTNVILALVNIPFMFIVVRFVEGALAAGLMPASMAIVGDSLPIERQGRWIGIMTTAQAAGIALGPGIGGFIYQSWGFQSPFLLSAGLAFIAALLALLLLPETLSEEARKRARLGKKERKEGATRGNTTNALQLALLFAPLILMDLGSTFIYPFTLPQYPFFFEKVLHYSAAQYGLIVSVYGLSLAVCPLILGRLSDLLPKRVLIVVGSLLLPLLNVAMLFINQYPLLIAAAFVTGAGSALMLPALGALYLRETTEDNRSQVMGVRGSAISLAILTAPLAQAAASLVITPQITFAIGSILGFGMALFAALALRSNKHSANPNAQ
ncbi:tetracycline resistance MFS efflux pump [Ktedonospora formicarum]|uniref:Tetracycline resistance MFS efflux pump n=2 Tax=Ktedonospora formicarum TaxID=2778364 RepID=A0A8J3I6B1_9CHLR|nr:tetracycline resistance MFS efflux pump [Ktedonospora formicarum]